MALIDAGKVIVAVGMNEGALRSESAHVPYRPDEIAADGIACARAGASILHFHARTADGGQEKTDPRPYQDAIAAIAREVQVLTYPVTYPVPGDLTDPATAPQLWELVDPPPGAPRQLAPFDCFRKGAYPVWDPDAGVLRSRPDLRSDGLWDPPPFLAELLRRDLVPVFVCFEMGDIRWAMHLARAGVIPQPVLVQVQLFGDMLWGPTPSPASLDALLSELQAGVEWEVFVSAQRLRTAAELDRLTARALERGVGMRAGLGDHPLLFPHARNVELVERAVERLQAAGLQPATVADLRARFNLDRAPAGSQQDQGAASAGSVDGRT
jgi:uncharacterized protein (DUF849 family)